MTGIRQAGILIIKEELKSRSPKETILAQLTELAENYGEIYEFWMDMQCWADTSLTTQEIYNLLKSKAPKDFGAFQSACAGWYKNYLFSD